MDEIESESDDGDRVGVLIVRVWSEGPLSGGLRARITRTLDLSTGEEVVTSASDPQTILVTVQEWLEAFTSG